MITRVILQFVVFVLFARVLTALSLWIVARVARPVGTRVAPRNEHLGPASLGQRGRALSRSST